MMKKRLILALVIVILIILNTSSIRGEKSGKRISESFTSINYQIENKARINWRPKSFIHPLVHVALNSFQTLTLTIENVGIATLYVYSISSEASWLSIEPDSAILPPGCCPLNVELTIIGGSEETFWVDSVRIQSNDQTGNDDVYVPMHVVVSDQENMDKLNDCVDMIMCGNVNRDNIVNIADVVYIINFLFRSGPEPWLYMGDCNADRVVSISDAVYLIGYLFKRAPPPRCSAL